MALISMSFLNAHAGLCARRASQLPRLQIWQIVSPCWTSTPDPLLAQNAGQAHSYVLDDVSPLLFWILSHGMRILPGLKLFSTVPAAQS